MDVSKFGRDSSLFAELICGDAVNRAVSLDRYCPVSICIDGVVCTFSKEVEAVLPKVPNQVASVDRHIRPLQGSALRYAEVQEWACSTGDRPGSFRSGRRESISRHSSTVSPSVTTSGQFRSCPIYPEGMGPVAGVIQFHVFPCYEKRVWITGYR